jgi:predicted PurR-regulated permease PerM
LTREHRRETLEARAAPRRDPGGGTAVRSELAPRAVFVSLLALTAYLMYRIFQPFLPAFAWAVVLAVAFHPPYVRLVRLLGGRDRLAAVSMSVLAVVLIVVPAVIVAGHVASGVAGAYEWLEARSVSGRTVLDDVAAVPWAAEALRWIQSRVDLAKLDLQGMLLTTLRTVGTALASGTRNLVVNVLHALLNLALILFTTTMLLRRGPELVPLLLRWLPLSEKDKAEVFVELRNVTRAVFFGVVLTALVQGFLGGLGFLLVGLPSPVTFGAAMFVCALLPAGTVLIWAPAALWLLATGHPAKAVILLVWGIAVVSSADNFLRPLFIGRGVRMPAVLVFFGTLGGMIAFGLVGLFVGPLVITLFLALLGIARREFLSEASSPAGPEA